MNPILLSLQKRDDAVHKPAAWFIAGADARHWLEEIVTWEIPHEALRLYVVPCSVADRTPVGVLVVPPIGVQVAVRPRTMPFGLLSGRLYVPCDATLRPIISEQELNQLCRDDTLVWHPSIGLVGFEKSSALQLSDVLTAPETSSHDWNHARGSAPEDGHLTAVRFIAPLKWENIFGDESSDIGKQPPSELPPSPEESRPSLASRTRDAVQKLLLKSLTKLTNVAQPGASKGGSRGRKFLNWLTAKMQTAAKSLEPPPPRPRRIGRFRRWLATQVAKASADGEPERATASPTPPGWLSRLRNWLSRKAQAAAEDVERDKSRDYHRLMHLLESDPENGLRFAVPMNRTPPRGISTGKGGLKDRDVDFDLGRIGKSGPTVPWILPPDLFERLRQRYLDLANREIGLGRFRRAAYIFAELLGDLHSAANVLKKGRHFREAAALYKDHLKLPLEAARCLEEGGLLAEAIDVYEALGEDLEVGKLWVALGNKNRAHEAYRRVVTKRLTTDDLLGAAQLLHYGLDATEEALQVLQAAWPGSKQAAECLGEQFRLLGKLGDHQRSECLMDSLEEQQTPFQLLDELIGVLVHVGAQYPSQTVRHRAVDLAKVHIGQRFKSADPATSRELVYHLNHLAPEDALLKRDSNRYLANLSTQQSKLHRHASFGGLPRPVRIHQQRLTGGGHWHVAKPALRCFWAAGAGGGKVLLARGSWHDSVQCQSLQWKCDLIGDTPLVLEPFPGVSTFCLLALPEGTPLDVRELPATNQGALARMEAGTPSWFPRDAITAVCTGHQVWVVRFSAPVLLLACYEISGDLVACRDVSELLEQSFESGEEPPENVKTAPQLLIAAFQNSVAVGLGRKVAIFDRSTEVTRLELDSTINGVLASPPHVRPCLYLTTATGISVYWLGSSVLQVLTQDLFEPITGLTSDGLLVAVDGHRGRLFAEDSRGLHQTVDFDLPDSRTVAVLRGGDAHQFARLTSDGLWEIYRIPY